MAFWKWRRSLDGADGKLLISAGRDAAAGRLAGAFTQSAVVGSNFGNGNLQNIRIKPADVDDIERQWSVLGAGVRAAVEGLEVQAVQLSLLPAATDNSPAAGAVRASPQRRAAGGLRPLPGGGVQP